MVTVAKKSEIAEKEAKEMIKEVNDFNSLDAAIDKIGVIKGSKKEYTPDELKQIIRDVVEVCEANKHSWAMLITPGKEELIYKTDEERLAYITNTFGIRNKVRELMNKE